MKGHIRKRGDSWELRVYAGTDAVTGKERTITKTFRGGKREAQRALAEFAADAQRGRLVRTSATVGELLEAWFDQARRDFSPKTIVETRGFIDRNLIPALGHVPLTRLKAGDLDRYYTRLTKSGSTSGGGLSPATVRRIHGILRRSLEQAVRWGWIGVNPAASASPPRVSQPELKPSGPEQVAKLLKLVVADP
jgi:integrase